MFGGDPDL